MIGGEVTAILVSDWLSPDGLRDLVRRQRGVYPLHPDAALHPHHGGAPAGGVGPGGVPRAGPGELSLVQRSANQEAAILQAYSRPDPPLSEGWKGYIVMAHAVIDPQAAYR